MTHDAAYSYVRDEAAAAPPGERTNIGTDDLPTMATATTHYQLTPYGFFRRFAWLDHEIMGPDDRSAAGMWLAVRGHWKQFVKTAGVAAPASPETALTEGNKARKS